MRKHRNPKIVEGNEEKTHLQQWLIREHRHKEHTTQFKSLKLNPTGINKKNTQHFKTNDRKTIKMEQAKKDNL